MTARRITLQTWLVQTYEPGEGPTLNTARSWARKGKLDPPAVKEGREYYVDPGARYNPDAKKKAKPTVAERLRAETENSCASGST